MSQRTVFLSRLIGLYCLLLALAMVTHKDASVATVTEMIHNSGVLMMAGVIALAAGLAIILSHNVWSGGALPVVVTLVGWAALLKGLLLLFLSPRTILWYFAQLHYAQYYYLYAAVSLLLGAYLTFRGFRANSY